MGHLEGNFTPVLYIGRKVPKVNEAVGNIGLDIRGKLRKTEKRSL